MAHFYLIISLFSCILFSQVNDLKVISYNIRYDNPDDGDNNWKYRKETFNILKKYKDEGYKLIKTKRFEHNPLTIDSRVFKQYFLSK